MNSNDHHYLRINHKNSLDILNGDDKAKLTLSLFTTIASVQEDRIGQELNNYFDQLIINNNSDLYEINTVLLTQYYSLYSFNDDQLYEAVNNVLKTDYTPNFDFQPSITENIIRTLVYCFDKLNNRKSWYQIKNHAQMLSKIDEVASLNIDAIRLFVSNNNTFSTKDSFSFQSNSFVTISSYSIISDGDYKRNPKGSCWSASNDHPQYLFTYPMPNKRLKHKDILPIEMIILLNKFQTVKKLSFTVDQVDKKQLMEILIILLNFEWLFPYLLEIDYDINNQQIVQELENIFSQSMSQKTKKTTMYNTNLNTRRCKWSPQQEIDDLYNNASLNNYNFSMFTTNNINLSSLPEDLNKSICSISPIKSSSIQRDNNDNNKSFENYILNHQEQIEIIIIYSYFISQMKRLQSFSLNIYDSFSLEIETLLNSKHIYLVDFHFLTFLSQITSLSELRVSFNSLDIYNFQKIIGIISNNPNLLNLRLSIFNTDDNYTPAALFKLCKRLKLNISDIFSDKVISSGDHNYDNCEVDHLLVNKLLNCFEDNLEKLFHMLFNYLTIQELIFNLALPKIISNNDSYMMVLIKFILNMIFFLTNESYAFKIFKIIAPEICFNCRKYPFIDNCLEEVNIDRKDIQLNSLTMQLGFDYVVNVPKMISSRLEYLFIGDFDGETFSYFIDYYTSKDFLNNSQLNSITVSLNNKLVNYTHVRDDLQSYFTHKPKRLIEQNLISFIRLGTKNEGKEIVDLIYTKNQVSQNTIEISEDKEVVGLVDIIMNVIGVQKSLMYVYWRIKKPKMLNLKIFKRIKQFLYLNKKNPFKL